jgi:peptidase E
MKKHIIAVGGGTFHPIHEPTAALERYLIKLSGKERPKVCFLPQASAEDEQYILRFRELFDKLGAQTSWVSLYGRVEPTWAEHLLSQDIIFVGGGNTKSMLALWRAWGVDEVLKQAYEKGIILAGVSAGAICWFEQGITDSVWPMGVLDCLGMLKGSCCPHYDSELERKPVFTESIAAGTAMPGIALSDFTAAHFIDGVLTHAFSWAPDRKVYLVAHDGHAEIEITSILD